LRGGSFARVLRTKALRTRRLPRTASPPPAAAGPHRNVPDSREARAGHGRQRRARCADRRAKVTRTGAGTPHIVRVGPSSVNGALHPRSAQQCRVVKGLARLSRMVGMSAC
jgi:hypothetical protein